jgi:hypothetical protein
MPSHGKERAQLLQSCKHQSDPKGAYTVRTVFLSRRGIASWVSGSMYRPRAVTVWVDAVWGARAACCLRWVWGVKAACCLRWVWGWSVRGRGYSRRIVEWQALHICARLDLQIFFHDPAFGVKAWVIHDPPAVGTSNQFYTDVLSKRPHHLIGRARSNPAQGIHQHERILWRGRR